MAIATVSIGQRRQTVLAYLFLFLVFFLVLKIIVIPVYLNWKEQRQNTQILRTEVLDAESQLALIEQTKLSQISGLEELLISDAIAYSMTASAAEHSLQERVKSVLKLNSAKLVYLRPSNEPSAEGLSASHLEVSFRMASHAIQPLLESFLADAPILHFDLVSISGNQKNLEASLNLTMWYVDSASSLSSAIDSTTTKSEGQQSHFNANTLSGLFDLNARKRLNMPSPKHYRVAAINVSQSARIAIVANIADGKTRRLNPGDWLDAWRVESIDSSGVRLVLGARTETLTLSQ